MSKTITWLHLSDLHARKKSDWDWREIRDTLNHDLDKFSREHSLRPDLIFFTGDAAFGAANGEKLADQYQTVKEFLDMVRKSFEPEIPIRSLYMVPGNHDIDRDQITIGEIEWLRANGRSLSDILKPMQGKTKQWHAWMERFDTYRNFLRSYGLGHLEPDDPHLIWADAVDIAGARVGISGFNSAWSAADDSDKGKLWIAGQYQLSQVREKMGPVDFAFGLIHHPSNWFTSAEDPAVMRNIRQRISIVLHGHEHGNWVDIDDARNILISAGACYQSSWMQNGYSFGQLDLEAKSGSVWLRKWDDLGRGWVAREVFGKTDVHGHWPLLDLKWIALNSEKPVSPDQLRQNTLVQSSGRVYTKKFCENIIEQLDYLELFGCDIPRELQRHQLSVAYVSLNVSPRRDNNDELGGESDATVVGDDFEEIGQKSGPETFADHSLSFETLIQRMPSKGRLTILGSAGAGKSTLLRWCATRAAQRVITRAPDLGMSQESCESADITKLDPDNDANWFKIPFLIKLRECPDGRLPPATEWPKFLAKHLLSAPSNWIIEVLSEGNALILLDGVDEIHKDHRPQVALEIEQLVKTYPNCSYVITSRPGAVPTGWLDRLRFAEATVEPMGRADREEFIDKWYRSAAFEIKRPRTGEDLRTTSAHLKQELNDQPELSILASNPLVCAMICALYRERQERLPETPSELSEALVQMLIHRRERETPGLTDAHFGSEWRALQYPQKKSLVADLAWHMINVGESVISNATALEIVRKAMAATPGRSENDAPSVLQAVVERSGLLRPDGDERIDFLHNTLKEFLAAGRAVEDDEAWLILAEHAGDPSWQPVILFALALGSESFSSNLIGTLLKQLPPRTDMAARKPGALNRAERERLASSNAKAFFLVRGKKAAKRLSPELSAQVDTLTEQLLPPAYMQDVESLAQLGPKLLIQSGQFLANPRWWAQQDVRMQQRCLRLLRLVGGSRAKEYLNSIDRLTPNSSALTGEWIIACTDLEVFDKAWPFFDQGIVSFAGSHVNDLRPISNLAAVRRLDASGSKVANLAPLSAGRHLTFLQLYGTPVEDLTPISELTNLTHLDIAYTRVSDLSPLRRLQSLELLRAYGTSIVDISPLAELCALKMVDLDRTKVSNIDALSKLAKLEVIELQGTKISSLEPLRELQKLKHLHINRTSVGDISPMSNVTGLQSLQISQTPVSDISVISRMKSLNKLVADRGNIVDITPLAAATHLRQLSLNSNRIVDASPLAACLNISELDIGDTDISDISFVASMVKLRSINLTNTNVDNLRPLCDLSVLHSVRIGGKRVIDLTPLGELKSLRFLYVSGSAQLLGAASAFGIAHPHVRVNNVFIRSQLP